MRRAWAIPLAVAGALLLSALLVRPPSTRQAAGLPVTPEGADSREGMKYISPQRVLSGSPPQGAQLLT
jgi:hypothetical protein